MEEINKSDNSSGDRDYLSDDDFDSLYSSYTIQRKDTSQPDQEFVPEFEDVTQLSLHGGVFKTTEKQSQGLDGRRRPWPSQFSNMSLLLRRTRRIGSHGREVWDLQLEIQSDILRQEFKTIADGFTNIQLERDPIIIPEPFGEIYFCRQRIQGAIAGVKSDEIKKQLKLLEDFRESYMAKTIMSIQTSLREGIIEAQDLWSLFPVGSQIILQNRHGTGKTLVWCAKVKYCQLEKSDNQAHPQVWEVSVEFMGFNGKQFQRAERTFHIGGFHGARNIRNLIAYPLDMHPHQELLIDSLKKRGKRYIELCAGQSHTSDSGHGFHCKYTGPFWELPKTASFFDKPTMQVRINETFVAYYHLANLVQHEGRMMIDPSGIVLEDSGFVEGIFDLNGPDRRYMPPSPSSKINRHTTWSNEDGIIVMNNISPADLIMTPPTIAAHSFSFKSWGMIDIDSVEPITWQKNAWDFLQMDEERKRVVRGVIESHRASSLAFDDFIPGKGRGLVLLLHGPPGCGKTMTAGKYLQNPISTVANKFQKARPKRCIDRSTTSAGPSSV